MPITPESDSPLSKATCTNFVHHLSIPHPTPPPPLPPIIMAEEDIATGAQRAVRDAIFDRLGHAVKSVWDFSLGFVVDFIFLRRNAEKLDEEVERLKELRDDLRNRTMNEAGRPQTEVIRQASGWMKRVEGLESEFTRFQTSLDMQSICTVAGFCLGHTAAEMLRRVEQLKVRGNALMQKEELVARRALDATDTVPFENSSRSIVGARETLQQIEGCVMDDRVGMIGIYGMGGIGKTTLLKIIYNEFLQGEAKDKFDVAIWVTVSHDANILRIQKDIGGHVNLSLSTGDGQGASAHLIMEQARMLFRKLCGKRFILFLDDVWKKLDTVNIGIPLPKNESNNCKILFTTRSMEVCSAMDADQRVKVRLLDAEHSWQLFRSKLGREVVLKDGEMQQLAKKVVERCGGLPISLITVGRAMAGASAPSDWRNAINSLDHCAVELSGMDDVLASLKFSFDMLQNDTLRSCLLYCVLFPEDHNIPEGQIIDYWMCEGFLDPERYQDAHIDQTRDRGHDQIRQLRNACLLQDGDPTSGGGETVRLHDTIRDLALRITSETFLALAGERATRLPEIGTTWKGVERISLMWNKNITELPLPEVSWPNLKTLLLRSSNLQQHVLDGFFKCSPALRVLDLPHSGLPKFQIGIASLIMLQYLNLSWTCIISLPKELGNLIHLRQLIMDNAYDLETIPREAISPLSKLQVLSMQGSGYVFGRHRDLALSDLQNQRRICELYLDVQSWQSLKTIAGSNLLRRCVRYLCVEPEDAYGSPKGDIVSVSRAISHMPQLRHLLLQDSEDNPPAVFHPCPHPSLEILRLYSFKTARTFMRHRSYGVGACEIPFQRLKELYIFDCHRLTELSWVDQLPCLRRFQVSECQRVRVVFCHGDGLLQEYYSRPFSKSHKMYHRPLSNLERMELSDLPALRSISPYPILFPSLKVLSVVDCPLLRRLPFGPQTAKTLKEIIGDQTWWDRLEWQQSSVKSIFLVHFKALAFES